MLGNTWPGWLAVLLTVVLSSGITGGARRICLPFLGKDPEPAKLGIAGAKPEQVKALGGSWYHNWGPAPENIKGVEVVPMVWGRDVPKSLGGNSMYVLGPNEPDMKGQSNLTPEEGAQVWRRMEQTYPDKRLISPVPSHEDPEWLVRFRDAYKKAYGRWPRLDGLAMHCYIPERGGCIALGQKFVRWAREWGVPEVWVTEFAFLPKWAPDAEGQAREWVAWLEAEPMIKRYAPFTSYTPGGNWSWPHTEQEANPSLFVGSESTELTDMGRWYKR